MVVLRVKHLRNPDAVCMHLLHQFIERVEDAAFSCAFRESATTSLPRCRRSASWSSWAERAVPRSLASLDQHLDGDRLGLRATGKRSVRWLPARRPAAGGSERMALCHLTSICLHCRAISITATPNGSRSSLRVAGLPESRFSPGGPPTTLFSSDVWLMRNSSRRSSPADRRLDAVGGSTSGSIFASASTLAMSAS